jgi:hypothetical protein
MLNVIVSLIRTELSSQYQVWDDKKCYMNL